ncbi:MULTISPECIES: RcpC/CpaB family pilus assembly protein [unclassified Streptomyces]|uniref:RcpC/CpaB family pilus assembly protein n=1 Tax=unclassified Streptomyces TaxID=2593676 RepID=UPI002E13158E|nr:RcpC/CpaB family pilus assembly protein [Streptomyces sp. NBC_01197]WSS49755.1 RcpC/CpaB family pilus assembly protein [Streptomyces sp. NBC_01180]
MPVPVVSAPEPRGVPPFAPLRVHPGRHRIRRALGRWRRTVVAGLVLAAAALAAWAPRDAGGAEPPAGVRADAPARVEPRAGAGSDGAAEVRARAPGAPAASDRPAPVSAPVRIADAATVRLLAPGDHVDVIAIDDATAGDTAPDGASVGSGPPGRPRVARVVATGVRVADVPDAGDTGGDASPETGALVVLAVPRSTATALAAAGATSKLEVTLC